MKKAKMITYGCQMNVNDSAKMINSLKNQGYEITENMEEADVILLNTCTVREGAAEKVYGKLGELKSLKKKNENLILGVTGCLAQEKKEKLLKKIPYLDIVMGNQNIHKLPEYIEKLEKKECSYVLLVDDEDTLPPRIDAEFESDISAFVSIMYGCNNFCTYCIVPYVRGRERSVAQKDVLRDVEGFIKKGVKEITLLGQNVNSYGKDLEETNFANLLKEICKIKGDFRIRFTSPHPRDFTDELIEVIKNEDKICKHIHLPLQAGSTKVLKKMNRGYTKEEYISLVEKIRNEISGISITADIIVGFPEETEEDFLDTLDVVSKSRYDNAYMFMYSKRSGTPASIMEEQISEETKKDRLQRLIKLQNKMSKEESEKYLGKTLKVLVEGTTKKNKEMYTGRSDGNKVVIFKGNSDIIGKYIYVEIKEAKTWTLYGDVK